MGDRDSADAPGSRIRVRTETFCHSDRLIASTVPPDHPDAAPRIRMHPARISGSGASRPVSSRGWRRGVQGAAVGGRGRVGGPRPRRPAPEKARALGVRGGLVLGRGGPRGGLGRRASCGGRGPGTGVGRVPVRRDVAGTGPRRESARGRRTWRGVRRRSGPQPAGVAQGGGSARDGTCRARGRGGRPVPWDVAGHRGGRGGVWCRGSRLAAGRGGPRVRSWCVPRHQGGVPACAAGWARGSGWPGGMGAQPRRRRRRSMEVRAVSSSMRRRRAVAR